MRGRKGRGRGEGEGREGEGGGVKVGLGLRGEVAITRSGSGDRQTDLAQGQWPHSRR